MTGPGGHPGATVVPLTSDPDATAAALTVVYESGAKFEYTYEAAGETFAVYANYPQGAQQ